MNVKIYAHTGRTITPSSPVVETRWRTKSYCVYLRYHVYAHIVTKLCIKIFATKLFANLPLSLPQGKAQLAEYDISEMYVERLTSEEPYSGLVIVIMMQHLYATQVSPSEAFIKSFIYVYK